MLVWHRWIKLKVCDFPFCAFAFAHVSVPLLLICPRFCGYDHHARAPFLPLLPVLIDGSLSKIPASGAFLCPCLCPCPASFAAGRSGKRRGARLQRRDRFQGQETQPPETAPGVQSKHVVSGSSVGCICALVPHQPGLRSVALCWKLEALVEMTSQSLQVLAQDQRKLGGEKGRAASFDMLGWTRGKIR